MTPWNAGRPNTLSSMGALAAVTNAVLLRRRNNNALCPDKPLQYDTQASVARIIQTVADVATAMRVTATREEDRIYTTYEGWLPDEEDRSTVKWQQAWCNSGLLRNTYPRASPAISLPLSDVCAIPTVDLSNPSCHRSSHAYSDAPPVQLSPTHDLVISVFEKPTPCLRAG